MTTISVLFDAYEFYKIVEKAHSVFTRNDNLNVKVDKEWFLTHLKGNNIKFLTCEFGDDCNLYIDAMEDY